MSNASDFVIEKNVLVHYQGSEEHVVIPEGVTEIGKEAFAYNTAVTKVTFPEGTTKIGFDAFRGCGGLREIYFSESVSEIKQEAFSLCENLTNVSLPSNLKTIGSRAFANCRNMKSCVFPNTLNRIGIGAFEKCISLKSAVIPDSVLEIGAEAFSGCSGLEQLVLSGALYTIEKRCFHGCTSLSEIVIPERTATVFDDAFGYCPSLKKVHIFGKNVRIENNAFGSYSDLLRISVEDLSVLPVVYRRNAILCFFDEGASEKDPRYEGYCKFIKSNAASLAELAFSRPDMLSFICNKRMLTAKSAEIYMNKAQEKGNANIIAVLLDYIGTKITAKQKERTKKEKEKQEEKVFEKALRRQEKDSVEGLVFAVEGRLETFGNKNELKQAIENKGAKLVSSISANVDYLISKATDSDSEKFSKAAELGIELITEAKLNELLERHFVIDGSGIVNKYIGPGGCVVVPGGTREIGPKAFAGCRTLTQVTIPESVIYISEKAFSRCQKLTDIFILNRRTKFDDGVFEKCLLLKIHGASNSHIENYAKKNNIPFVAE